MLDENFRENIQEIAKSNVKIILVYPIPEVGFDPKIRLKKYKFFQATLQIHPMKSINKEIKNI